MGFVLLERVAEVHVPVAEADADLGGDAEERAGRVLRGRGLSCGVEDDAVVVAVAVGIGVGVVADDEDRARAVACWQDGGAVDAACGGVEPQRGLAVDTAGDPERTRAAGANAVLGRHVAADARLVGPAEHAVRVRHRVERQARVGAEPQAQVHAIVGHRHGVRHPGGGQGDQEAHGDREDCPSRDDASHCSAPYSLSLGYRLRSRAVSSPRWWAGPLPEARWSGSFWSSTDLVYPSSKSHAGGVFRWQEFPKLRNRKERRRLRRSILWGGGGLLRRFPPDLSGHVDIRQHPLVPSPRCGGITRCPVERYASHADVAVRQHPCPQSGRPGGASDRPRLPPHCCGRGRHGADPGWCARSSRSHAVRGG